MKLSIIIPCFNAEKYILSLLNKLKNQILPDIEVIIINDGSTDFSDKIVKNFCKENYFCKVISQNNKGVSGARNAGINASSGDYIWFLDSDDSIEDHSIQNILSVLDKESDLFCFSYTSIYNDIKKKYSCNYLKNKEVHSTVFIKAFLSKKIPCHICSIVIKRDLLVSDGLFFTEGLRIGEDMEFLLKLFQKINNAYINPSYCYIYQIRNDSTMQGYCMYNNMILNAYVIRKNIVLSPYYQTKKLSKYSNFWLQNQLLSNIITYYKSDTVDDKISNYLRSDCKLFRKNSIFGNFKYGKYVAVAKVIPIALLLKVRK